MALPKSASKAEDTKAAPSTGAGKAVVAEPVATKPAAAAPAPVVVEAPKTAPAAKTAEAPKATTTTAAPAAVKTEVESKASPPTPAAAVKIEEASKAATPAPAPVVKTEEPAPAVTTAGAAKAVVAVEEVKAPEDVASTSEETPKVEETARELPKGAEIEAPEQDLSEPAPVEPSIPEFAEESNVVGELKAHEKKSLEEFKLTIEKAIAEKTILLKAPKKKIFESITSINIKASESEPIVPKESVKEVTETTPATPETSSATDAPESSAAAATEETKEAVVEKVEEKSKDLPTPVTPPASKEKVTEKAKEAVPVAAAPPPAPSTPVETKPAAATEKPKEAPAPTPVVAKPKATEKAKDATPAIVAAAAPVAGEKAKEVAVAAPVLDEKSKDGPVDAAPSAEPVLEAVTPVFVENSDDVEPTVEAKEAPVVPVEEVAQDSTPLEDLSLWGVPLLHTKGDKRTDVILLKFLRARDFNVNQAFKQLKKTLIWRKHFQTDTILEEEFGTDLDGVACMHGQDREGHPVCYNVFGTLEDKELYQKTFGDSAKIAAFIRWRVQVLEKGIGLLNFTPEGPSAMVQIVDMKNTGFFTKKDIKSAANQATDLLQDNYPEMVARKIFVNSPWYFNALYSVVSPFFSQRSKSKFTVAPAGKTTEYLLKFIPADHIPVQYGGLSRTNDPEFSGVEAPVQELILKAGEKQSIEIPLEKAGTSVTWDLTVVGYEVNYEAEFVPATEGAYAITIDKSKKLPASTESPIRVTFKAPELGKLVLTVDNSSKKKKIVLYRYLVKAGEAAAV